MQDKFCVVFITAPTLEEGRELARGLLEEKLAACVNLFPGVESSYWWDGKIETAKEVFLLVKTSTERAKGLEAWVKAHHSYTVPEVLALPILEGSRAYLNWLQESVQ